LRYFTVIVFINSILFGQLLCVGGLHVRDAVQSQAHLSHDSAQYLA